MAAVVLRRVRQEWDAERSLLELRQDGIAIIKGD